MLRIFRNLSTFLPASRPVTPRQLKRALTDAPQRLFSFAVVCWIVDFLPFGFRLKTFRWLLRNFLRARVSFNEFEQGFTVHRCRYGNIDR